MAKRECAECCRMDLSRVSAGKFKCEKDGAMRYADSDEAMQCRLYSRRWACNMGGVEEAKKTSKVARGEGGYTAVGCYITTMVVNILGISDDCNELETLRMFRKEVLQKDEKYKELLMKYDVLGPILASQLCSLENAQSFAEDLFNVYIKGCARYIEKGKIVEAIILYEEMTQTLIDTFINSYAIGDNVINLYDQSSGGHGQFCL